MNNKYLPIGSVCNINNDSELLMIVGYKKNGKDYEGLHFPEGTNSTKGNVYFNHDEINELYALGYKNSSSISFSKELLAGSYSNSSTEEVVTTTNSSIVDKYIFDENGIIIADNTVPTKVNENNSIFNKYEFDENGVIIADNTVSSKIENDSVFNKYVFDENGIVIAENRPAVEPAKVEDIPSFGEIEFDSNGVIVSSNETTPRTGRFEFDENGIVIAEHKEGE